MSHPTKHLSQNNRDPILVPELEGLQCDIQIPANSWYFDSAHHRPTTVNRFVSIRNQALLNDEDPDDAICAIVGPVDASNHAALATLTESVGIPQIAYGTVDRRLNNPENFPFLARLVPEAVDVSAAIAKYIQRDILQRQYLGVIYHSSDFGEQFEDPLEDAEDSLGYETITESFDEGDDGSIEESLGEAKEKGYRTIFLVTDRLAVLDNIATVAESLGMLGEGYVWMINADALNPVLLPLANYPVDSPMDKLLRGAIMISHLDPFFYEDASINPFLNMWRSQNSSIIADLNSRVPTSASGTKFYSATESYFQDETPTWYSSYMYDSVIAAGLSACKAQVEGLPHHEALLQLEFSGASGRTSFRPDDEDEGKRTARNSEAGVFGAHNVRPGKVVDGMQFYEAPLTAIYNYYNEVDGEAGAWMPTETEFLFFDGTTTEPMPLRTISDKHFLSKGVQITGLSLASVAFVIAVISAMWVYFRQQDTLIKAAQPEFLYLMCFGSMLVSSSLFFISFDEDKGWSEEQLDRGCSAFPWFFCLGYIIMYCAVFSKLWRLSKLLQMKRRSITMKQVLIPFMIVVSTCITILIVMQTVSPVEWQRTIIRGADTSDEPLETYGECTLNDKVEFLAPLFVLFVIVIVMSASISWQCREIQEDLSDAKWVFAAIFCHLQMWLVGIPILVITDDVSRDANYLMIAALIFAFSTTMVVLVIGPKQWMWVRDTYFETSTAHESRASINHHQEGGTRVSGIDLRKSGTNPVLSSDRSSLRSGNDSESMCAANTSTEKSLPSLELEAKNLRSKLQEVEDELANRKQAVESPETAPSSE